MPKQQRVFEWCAGPAFIGFSLLANGLCETLCVADINDQAVEACRKTVRDNELTDRVSVYEFDNLLSIPPSEKWDLVVGNPPFYPEQHGTEICAHDEGWHIHRGFFANVGRFLIPGGVILLQEANDSSTAETFRNMIEGAGLSIALVHGSEPGKEGVFFMGVIRHGETPPAWLTAASSVPVCSSWSNGPADGRIAGQWPWSA